MELKLDYSQVRFQENGRLKLLIIVGTRPEIIRLAAVINKCRSYFDCLLAHTGQNYRTILMPTYSPKQLYPKINPHYPF